VLALTACTGGSRPQPPVPVPFEAGTTMARLAKAGKITIGTKFDQPGFGLLGSSGMPEGFDVEIGRMIAAGLGLGPEDIDWVETTADAREAALTTGAVDLVVATYTITPARRRQISFAGPYYIAGQQVMVRSDNETVTGPDSFTHDRSLRVCSSAGSTPAARIRRYLADPGQLVTFDGYARCAQALRDGTVDAVTTDSAILLGLAAESSGAFKIVGDPFTEEPYGVGIPRGDTGFCTFVNSVLTRAAADGSYAKAWARTAGRMVGTRPASLPLLDACD
jgi:glutamate transport system substrate-binding protein